MWKNLSNLHALGLTRLPVTLAGELHTANPRSRYFEDEPKPPGASWRVKPVPRMWKDDSPGPFLRLRSSPNGSTRTEWTLAPSKAAAPASPHKMEVRLIFLSGE